MPLKTRTLTRKSSSNEDSNDELEEKISRLKEEIKKLKHELLQGDTVQEIEKPTTFGEFFKLESKSLQSSGYEPLVPVPNMTNIITQELYKLSGLYCHKMSRNKCVFKMCIPDYDKSISTYSIELLHEDNSTIPGNYSLPQCVDVKNILSSLTPFDSKMFIMTCKHHVNCYHERRRQFFELQSITENVQNCKLFSNTGYTCISLQMWWACNAEKNENYNFQGQFLYDSQQCRPKAITVSPIIIGAYSFDEDDVQVLTDFLKPFKTLELSKAYEQISKDKSSIVYWQPKIRNNIALNNTELDSSSNSDSDDSFSKVLQSMKKKSKRRMKKQRVNSEKNSTQNDTSQPNSENMDNETTRKQEKSNREIRRTGQILVRKKVKNTSFEKNQQNSEGEISPNEQEAQTKEKRKEKNITRAKDSKRRKLTKSADVSTKDMLKSKGLFLKSVTKTAITKKSKIPTKQLMGKGSSESEKEKPIQSCASVSSTREAKKTFGIPTSTPLSISTARRCHSPGLSDIDENPKTSKKKKLNLMTPRVILKKLK